MINYIKNVFSMFGLIFQRIPENMRYWGRNCKKNWQNKKLSINNLFILNFFNMSNTQVLTPTNISITYKPSKMPSSWLRRLLYMSPLLVTLLLTWCWERKDANPMELRKNLFEELGKKVYIWEYLVSGRDRINFTNIRTPDKTVIFYDKNFTVPDVVLMWSSMTDNEKRSLWFPTSDDKKIQALISLTPEERIALWVEKDYQEFLALLKKSKI